MKRRTKVFVCTKTNEEVKATWAVESRNYIWWECPTCDEVFTEEKKSFRREGKGAGR